MSELTFEYKEKQSCLETYEWDNVWWEQTNIKDVPRVLYVGDSISVHTRRIATGTAKGEFLFDGFATSKAVDNPYFADSVRIFGKQQGERCAVLFNNGLHGWHLEDETEYRHFYEQMICFFIKEFPNTPFFLLLTTYVADPEQNARVQVRNRVVCELAQKYALPVIDLYSIIEANANLLSDGVHMQREGYQLLANEIIQTIKDSK